MTALSVFGINTASPVTLTTAMELVTASGGATVAGTGTKVGTVTGYGEVTSQGSLATWAGAGSIGTPTGLGWLFDVTTLEGQTIAAGTWTIAHHWFNSGTTPITADLYGRVYKRSSGGVYTLIGTLSLLAQSIPISSTAFSMTGSLPSMAFASGDKLYHDVWFNVASGSSGTGVKFNDARGSSTNGAAGFAEVDTPGYAPTPGGHVLISDGFGGMFT
jgi:hypothetical protein